MSEPKQYAPTEPGRYAYRPSANDPWATADVIRDDDGQLWAWPIRSIAALGILIDLGEWGERLGDVPEAERARLLRHRGEVLAVPQTGDHHE